MGGKLVRTQDYDEDHLTSLAERICRCAESGGDWSGLVSESKKWFGFIFSAWVELDNFNMSKKKHQKNPEFEVSFSKQNNRQIAEDNRLTLEMLRVHAT